MTAQAHNLIATENMFELMCFLNRFPGDDCRLENQSDVAALSKAGWIERDKSNGWKLSHEGQAGLRVLYGDDVSDEQGLVLVCVLKHLKPHPEIISYVLSCQANGWIWASGSQESIEAEPDAQTWNFTAQGLKVAQAIESRIVALDTAMQIEGMSAPQRRFA